MTLVNNWTWLGKTFNIFPLFRSRVLSKYYLISTCSPEKILLLGTYFSRCSLINLIQEMVFLQWHSRSSQGAPDAFSIISVKSKALPVMGNRF